MPIDSTATEHLTFATDFGTINVEPGDEYRINDRNQLEYVKRVRQMSDGTLTTLELDATMMNSGDM
jgi:hypothetical protein